jgi:hypothetical protein
MSAPEPRESTWHCLLHSQDDAAIRVRFVLLVSLLAAGGFGGSKVIEALRHQEPVQESAPDPERRPAVNPNGGLVIDPAELDFGEVWEQRQLDIPITVRNPTDHEIEIQGWLGPNRFDIEPRRVIVPANESAVLQAHFDPIFGRKTSDALRVVESEYLFKPDIPDEPGIHPGWRLKGRVKRAVWVSTDRLKLSAEPLQRGAAFPSTSVDVMAFQSLRSLKAAFDEDALVVEVSGPSIQNWYQVSVKPAPSVPSGGHTNFVELQAELRDGVSVPTFFEVSVNVE